MSLFTCKAKVYQYSALYLIVIISMQKSLALILLETVKEVHVQPILNIISIHYIMISVILAPGITRYL